MLSSMLPKGVTYVLIYTTLLFFLVIGLYAGKKSRNDLNLFIKSIYTQGLLSLSLNFVAASSGASLFVSLPQIGTIAGVFGVLVFSFACAIPIIVFGFIGPIFRKHNSYNWSMSSFITERFGLYLNIMYCLICIFFMLLYMVGEVATLYSSLGLLTSINPLPPTIVLCVVTTIYS
ncbi:hypothetical protein BB561_007037, partial [Smittium simulii]